jgi:hypothetical protein
MTTKPPLQKILKEILLTDHENKHNHEGIRNIKPHENRQALRESIELVAQTQILKHKNN